LVSIKFDWYDLDRQHFLSVWNRRKSRHEDRVRDKRIILQMILQMVLQWDQVIGVDLAWDLDNLAQSLNLLIKKENVKRLISCYKADNSSREKGQKSEGK